MEIVKLGKSGQVSIPREFVRRLGVETGATFLAELNDRGEIVLRLAGVYPIEIYTDERIAEFLAEDEMTPEEKAKLKKWRARK